MSAARPPFHIVLVEPEIPPNTGNIARLCAATGAALHLIEPLGFDLDDRQLKRAGMDYWQRVDWRTWPGWEAFLDGARPERLHLFTTKAAKSYWDARYREGDWLIFGRETKGLPESLRTRHAGQCVRIPIAQEESRSLNLATSVGIGLYEALRQLEAAASYPGRD
ncbi:MAG: tRNA (cytidine(34)-2'-O)-methyltransferase [Verrucomicrobiota bacterium]